MRTGSGNRSYYNRTTGSRTARLYSKRTARRINKAYQSSQAQRIRNIQYDELQDRFEDYDDYYDNPKHLSSNGRKSTVIIAASLIVAILAFVIVGLALMKPSGPRDIGLAQEPGNVVQAEPPVSPQQQIVVASQADPADSTQTDTAQTTEQTTTAFEESDPPVIYGVMPIIVYAGHSVAYKQGIHITDDNDPDPVLEIDNTDVDLSTPGNYIVTYIARDRNGNVTRIPTTVTVLAGQNIVSDEEIYELADSILDVIITEDENTDALKCLKVYEYLHAIGYVDEVHSEDWMQNAYWMLKLREGDCFCYYSAARLLLTRLGYDVMEVRNNNNYVHFWCLVSIDGGDTWWHFDPTCWSWGEDGVVCLVSDTYLQEFTRRHRTSDGRLIHAWDRTNYPATPETDFWTDEDRAVIYEGGLIELEPEYDLDDDIWGVNEGWDYYPVTYYYDESAYVYEEEPDPYVEDYVLPDEYTEPQADYIEEEPYEPYDEGETYEMEDYSGGEYIVQPQDDYLSFYTPSLDSWTEDEASE